MGGGFLHPTALRLALLVCAVYAGSVRGGGGAGAGAGAGVGVGGGGHSLVTLSWRPAPLANADGCSLGSASCVLQCSVTVVRARALPHAHGMAVRAPRADARARARAPTRRCPPARPPSACCS